METEKGKFQRIREGRFPLSGSLEVTHRCNLRCQHCYVNLPASDEAAKNKELSSEEIFRVIDEAAECGLLSLLLTGGEPLLRHDFKEIYRYCKRKGIFITLYTNGTLIDSEMGDFLAEWPPTLVQISLYGATAQTYEAVTGIRGSFRRCMEGIERLIERKIPLRLKAIVMTLNHQELKEMEKLAKTFGSPLRYGTYGTFLSPRLDGRKDPLRFRLSPEQVLAIDLERPTRMREYRKRCLDCPASTSRALYPCEAGKRTFNIDPTGKLTVCMLSRRWPYDLRSGNFKEAWLEWIPKRVLSQKRDPLPCDRCNIRHLCSNHCPALSELEMGKSGEIVPYLCEWAHRLAGAFGLRPNTPVFQTKEDGNGKKMQEEHEEKI